LGFDPFSRFRKRSADDPPATESWPVFAFGKLPVYKDFISAGLTEDASREFRDWLSNGFSRHWSSRDEYRATEIPLHAFLLRLPGSRKVAVGALWGSRDQGGLRKFPFAIFSLLAPGKPEASVLTALDYLPVFEGRAREIRRKYDAAGSLADVYQELRRARIEVPVRTPEQIRARLAASLSTPRVGPLARALFGQDAEARWPALLAGLDAAARRASDGAGAFRLPLADEPTAQRQLQLWTVRMTRASSEGTGPSGLLYRTGGEVPCGVVFYRDVRPEDILLLHPGAAPTDFVEEIPPPVLQSAPQEEAASPAAITTAPAPEAAPQVEPAPPVAAVPPEETIPPEEPPRSETEAVAAGAPESPPGAAAAEVPTAEAPVPPPAPPNAEAAVSPASAATLPEPPTGEPKAPVPAGWDLSLATLLGSD
jgi:type VI secretion system ImpM family protein